MKDTAYIVYASDDKFSEIMGVSLVSLLENSRDIYIVLYILDSGIRKENKEKIEAVCNKYKQQIIWLKAKNITKELSMGVRADRGSLSQYARLFVSSSLPENLDRVLYLDCDIIIEKSIKELWKLNLHGKIVGALMDAFSKYYRQNIDLEENDIMFNSGVMLIDLKKWREQQIEKKLKDFIFKKNGRIQQGDQGALNAVLSHDTYCIEPRFNAVTIFFDFSYKEMMIYRKPPKFYNESEILRAVESPTIIHFTTSFLSKRAWMKGCNHRYVSEWMKYKEMSPWKDNALWDDDRPEWKQKGLIIYRKLPRRLAIRIVSAMQVYGRPLMNKIKNFF